MTFFEPVAVDHGVARGTGQHSTAGRLPRRDRHGRGLRGPLMPAGLPGARTRDEQFADHLAAAVSRLAEVCGPAVDQARFRTAMVPEDLENRLELVRAWGAGLVDDPTGSTRRDAHGTAVITIYRRPIEARCPVPALLPDLVYGAVVEQWAALTGMAPESVDPGYHW
jgi:hypothetical protein